MGIKRMGPPKNIVLLLKEKFNINTFVEAGTFYGNTAVWASSCFFEVITIEYSKELYQNSVSNFGDIKNINFIYGDSRSHINQIITKLDQVAIFWLDSHWCGEDSYGENDQCPIIEEINIINHSIKDHFIFIDDARLFLAPPPDPCDMNQWPTIDQIIQTLQSGNKKYYIVIIEDVIIAVPLDAKKLLSKYCQNINTKKWIEINKQKKSSSQLKDGCILICKALYQIIKYYLSPLNLNQKNK